MSHFECPLRMNPYRLILDNLMTSVNVLFELTDIVALRKILHVVQVEQIEKTLRRSVKSFGRLIFGYLDLQQIAAYKLRQHGTTWLAACTLNFQF